MLDHRRSATSTEIGGTHSAILGPFYRAGLPVQVSVLPWWLAATPMLNNLLNLLAQ